MASKKYLSKAEIFAQDDLKYEDVQVPEWGDAWVRVRTMSASERDRFDIGMVQGKGKNRTANLENMRARLCLMCIVDENGERVFQEEDTFPLGGKSAAALDRIFTAARRLNGLGDEDVEELVGESSATQNGASPSV